MGRSDVDGLGYPVAPKAVRSNADAAQFLRREGAVHQLMVGVGPHERNVAYVEACDRAVFALTGGADLAEALVELGQMVNADLGSVELLRLSPDGVTLERLNLGDTLIALGFTADSDAAMNACGGRPRG